MWGKPVGDQGTEEVSCLGMPVRRERRSFSFLEGEGRSFPAHDDGHPLPLLHSSSKISSQQRKISSQANPNGLASRASKRRFSIRLIFCRR